MIYGWNIKKGELNPAIQRYIKRKEKELDRTCRSILEFENPLGEWYLFASFCKNYDKLVVTIGYFDPRIHRYIVPQ